MQFCSRYQNSTTYHYHTTRSRGKANRSYNLAAIKRVTLGFWEAEDEETKNKVFAAMAIDKTSEREAILIESEDPESRIPLRFQRCVM